MGTYDYTDNEIADAIVDTESDKFKAAVNFVATNAPYATTSTLEEYTGSTWGSGDGDKGHSVTRCNVVFQGGGAQSTQDAYLVQEFPDTALAQLYSDYKVAVPGGGLPKFADANPPEVNPVGSKVPAMAGIWNVSADWTEAQWPMGSTFDGRLDGRDVRWYRTKIKSGSAYTPAWTDKAPA